MSARVPIGACADVCQSWNPLAQPSSRFSYIDIASVDRDTKLIQNVTTVKGSEAPSRARQIVKAGDVLVSTVRPNLNAVAQVPAALDGATASTGFTVLRPNEKLDSRYLFHWVTNPAFVADMVRKATGASYPAVSDRIVRESLIPLPPLPEQRRIAAILDKADALRAKRREAIAKLDQLLQSVFLEMFGDPVTNPKGWATRRFTDVGVWKSGATPSKSNDEFWSGTVPWVSPKDMKVNVIRNAQDHVSEAAFAATSLKRIDPGHLLIVVRGMILAHSFPTAINAVPIAINQDMKAIMPADEIEAVYLKAAVESLKARILSGVSSAGHGTRRLDTRDAAEVMIPVPPRDLQARFKTISVMIADMKGRQLDQVQHSDRLFSAIQADAFTG